VVIYGDSMLYQKFTESVATINGEVFKTAKTWQLTCNKEENKLD
jgi:hypothetical protein